MLSGQLITQILHRLPEQTFSIKRVKKLWMPAKELCFEEDIRYLLRKHTMGALADG